MKYPSDREAKELLIRVGKYLYESGLNTGVDGNFSCLTGDGMALWTTGSGSAKGFLTQDDLVKTDLNGMVLQGEAKPSSELKIHQCVYHHNELAGAVIHTHSVAATALACGGVGLIEPIFPAVLMQLGKVFVTPYATPGTQAVADGMLPYIEENNGVLLGNHGPVTWGKDLWQAMTRMETLEQSAKIYLQMQSIGKVQYLSREQEQELRELGVKLGHFKKV